MSAPFSFIPSSLVHRCLLVGSLAIILTAALELTCLDEVRKLRAAKDGKALCSSALWTNIVNSAVLLSITYYIGIEYFCQPCFLPATGLIKAIVGIVVIQAVLYYFIHKALHEVKGHYWINSYHHKFNTVVVPSSANAVSVAEYGFAYMLPLVVGVVVTRADETAAFLGAAIVAITNLLIHTPWLEEQKYH
jgi:sterol desaturase/sphingolipid hydroxylase (fatty acid hydroxylase superfamily)